MSNDNRITKREQDRPAATNGRERRLSPPCDIYESASEFLVVAEMPGVDEQSIDLHLDRSRLTIEATRTMDGESPPSLRYVRAFEVPSTIDSSQIHAELRAGVLRVHLPKAAEARVRRIAVQAG